MVLEAAESNILINNASKELLINILSLLFYNLCNCSSKDDKFLNPKKHKESCDYYKQVFGTVEFEDEWIQ